MVRPAPVLHLRITGSGAPVLLLHGAPSSADDFRPLVESLGRRHRFLWPDLPGYGLTGPLEGKTSVARVQTLLEETVLSLGIKELAIVGVSFGAYRALSLALGQRLRITDLVLISPIAAIGAAEATALRENAAVLRGQSELRDPGLRGAFTERMLSEEARSRPEAVKQVEGWLEGTTGGVVADDWEAFAEARDLLPHVGLLKARTTVRCGGKDTLFSPQQTEELAKRIRGAKLQRVPEAGHAVWVEDPHRTLEALDEALKAQVAPRREE